MATTIPEQAPQEPHGLDETPATIERERLKREDPKRSGPIRSASHYFRDSHSWDDGAPDPAPCPEAEGSRTQTLDDVITRGVHLGYKVIEEHLLKGQRAAQQLRQPDPGPSADPANEFDAFVEQAQRLYQDLGTLCFDALEVLVRSPALLRGRARAGQPGSSCPEQKTSSHGNSGATASGFGADVAIEIASRQRTRVDLHLNPNIRRQNLHTHALHAPNPTMPPLTGVAFRMVSGLAAPILEINIPDHQPPALYSGVVVDSETNEPVGTLTLRIIASPIP